MKLVTRFFKDESGATAIEYGLIAALISVGIITAATLAGQNLTALWTTIGDELESVGGAGAAAADNG